MFIQLYYYPLKNVTFRINTEQKQRYLSIYRSLGAYFLVKNDCIWLVDQTILAKLNPKSNP